MQLEKHDNQEPLLLPWSPFSLLHDSLNFRIRILGLVFIHFILCKGQNKKEFSGQYAQVSEKRFQIRNNLGIYKWKMLPPPHDSEHKMICQPHTYLPICCGNQQIILPHGFFPVIGTSTPIQHTQTTQGIHTHQENI